MNYCVRCGNSLRPSDRFCGRCGQAVARMPAAQPSYPSPPPPPRLSSQTLRAPGLPVTGSHFSFLFAISGFLLLLAVVGLGLFLTAGLSAALSEDKLAELGINNCRFVDDNAADVFSNTGLERGISGEMDVRRCRYENISYYMYPASDFQVVFQTYVSRRFCEGSGSFRERMETAREALGNLEASYIFQTGQYIFSTETEEDQKALKSAFREKGLSIRATDVPITCFA